MQIPLLSGAYADESAAWRTAYPRNYVPVPKEQGVSKGFFRPAEGLTTFAAGGPGLDRGAEVWNGVCYRVMGSKLVRVEGTGQISVLGDVGGQAGDRVIFDKSFDRLRVASDGRLWDWNGNSLRQVTDPDLGAVLDVLWVDGYWMTTDGSNLVVTELNDPFSVLPTKYGSSESDPDAIVGLLKLRNEVHAINRYTTEVFNNVGGNGFPFQRTEGALIQCGALGTRTCCIFGDAIAVLGSGYNEPPGVWLLGGGSRQAISTAEVDQVLSGYSEAQLRDVLLEARMWRKHEWLYMHLPDCTWVFDLSASKALGEQVWFRLDSGLLNAKQYRAQNWTWCYDRWLFGDTVKPQIGTSTDDVSSHYGEVVGWELQTTMLYNDGRGAVVHELELVALTGRVALGVDPTVWTSYTLDGETWSREWPVRAGKQGDRMKRLRWLQQGPMSHFRGQKFRGTSDAHIAVTRLEAQIEALNA